MIEVAIRHRQGALDLAVAFESRERVTALLGRSGAGKTTTLNIIAGLIAPDSGHVAVDGRVLLDTEKGISVPPHRRRIGYVFQDARLFPHLTVRQNLVYGARRVGRPRAETERDCAHLVALLGIEALLPRRAEGLSGGEKQRVAIGRALLAAPEILLLDEPLSGLDMERRDEVLTHIETLKRETDVPMLYVSHLPHEVERIADAVVHIDRA
jgi:molybdate transport system ATP-binding protein